jgi:hypothetical protein
MKIFKYIKDGKLYILYNLVRDKIGHYTALPYRHNGRPIDNCNMSEFMPYVDMK